MARPRLHLSRASFAGVAVVLAGLPHLSDVSQTTAGPALMRGLPGVAVVAEQVEPNVRSLGLDEAWLRKFVVTSLRRDSITILDRGAALASPRQPLLMVRLESVEISSPRAIAWHLSLGLHQSVRSAASDSEITLATTWEAASAMGLTSRAQLLESVGRSLTDQVNEFLRDWRRREREP